MKKNQGSEPPSLFDNLDLFAPAPSEPAKEAKPSAPVSAPTAEPHAVTAMQGLTVRGPMRDLYDFNFRQYSAYVICSRAIPAVEVPKRASASG